MEYYKYYLSVGLGTWLMAKVVDSANPQADQGFVEEVVSFLITVLVWPISLVVNYVHSLQIRKLEQEMADKLEEMMALMSEETSLDAPEAAQSNESDVDEA